MTFEVSLECVDWDTLCRARPLLEVLPAKSLSDREGYGRLLCDHHDGARTLDAICLWTHGVVLP